ncbi:carboxymuconolactone decarboxylase family protein [Streptomyces sp. WM6386]|uniref:carboxymuconolactone decarboxylase family protein n=1 Tax=Streptomyces sp. WM6386 TaxID=1415558 RepID=UPI0006199C93|nr:carboxymuconolactone decarboxylase family protein [Streptomyces sp. WM6386]
MTAVEPVPRADLDQELNVLIGKARASRALSSDLAVRIWAHRPELAKAQLQLQREVHEGRLLDGRLMELVRLRIAALNDCRACQVARKSDDVSEEEVACLSADDPRFTAREAAALRFAELFAIDHLAVDDVVLGELNRHFTAAEIVELGMFAALMLGSGRLVRVLRAYEDDDRPPVIGV